ncbi:hypothetical protein ACU635_27620 [[Actinomadura] parvosata]|uniref:hypothetical protein n=1 Tax=[Actinomadura] parvosata TaxID=1955412 RepID=UPI00406C6CCD
MTTTNTSADKTPSPAYTCRLPLSTQALTFLADLAAGSAVSASTARRWALEVIDLLAARAPRLRRALKKIAKQGGEVVLLDGALVRTSPGRGAGRHRRPRLRRPGRR